MTNLATPSTVDLRSRAIAHVLKVILVRAGVVFLAAWSVHYWQAWVFVGLTAVSETITHGYLLRRDPALLERRIGQGMKAPKEQRSAQKTVQTTAMGLTLVTIVLAANDHCHGWSTVPTSVNLLGFVLVAASQAMVFLVFKTNTYAAATVEVHENQTVVSTGPYALVRHPMYTAVVVLLIGLPLALGSLWGVLPGMVMTAVLAARLKDEEKMLAGSLAGYTEYQSRVRHRLVPLVW
jgi:protein-S-isoprenylcysteine O-methyltransferase Ste14